MLKLLCRYSQPMSVVGLFIVILATLPVLGQELSGVNRSQRVFENQRFHQQARQKMGLLIPLYVSSRWIYVTQDTYKANDPEHPNPWDNLFIHLEAMCRTLTE